MTDPTQFESFVRDYQDMVYTTAFRLVGKETDAEDIAQEVFLRAYEHFGTLSESKTCGGWLKTVARNLSLNHLGRYRARWRFFSEFHREDEDEAFEAHLASPEADAGTTWGADQRELLDEALLKLPDTQRIPLVLYHFEDMNYDEIAAQLKVSLGKVKTDIHRGREALRKRLATQLEELQA